ncbi:MAG TPA: serine hydrolase [bacterium]|jgi:D-alanyl-D-alanine carboxypeptidase (penicillin-binding protein 5/6)|nr:serine hydrolase [bacterium]HOG37956.1 serine hydrolase [bacterium]HQI03014.1 serine hydrolase [bacterium]
MRNKFLIIFLFILIVAIPANCFALEKKDNYVDFTNWYKEKTGKDVPYISAAVIEYETLKPLYFHQEERQMPSASLMKLITASEFVKHFPLWNKTYNLTWQDSEGDLRQYVGPRDSFVTLKLKSTERIKIKDIFASTLIASANNSANKLSKITEISKTQFLENMGKIASEWGLTKTLIDDPSGLSMKNLTSARDMAIVTCHAFSNENISEYSSKPQYTFTTREGRQINLKHTVYDLRNNPQNYFGAKTGFLNETRFHVTAGYITPMKKKICVAVLSVYKRSDSEDAVVKIGEWVDEMYK